MSCVVRCAVPTIFSDSGNEVLVHARHDDAALLQERIAPATGARLKSLYETDASGVAQLSEIKNRMHRKIVK